MTLDPDAQRVVEMAKASTAPLYEQVDPSTARALYKKGRRVLQPAEPQAVAEVRELSADGPHGAIPLRAYYPAGAAAGALPAVVYYHGGGWVIGDLDSHDGVCRQLANASGCVVVSVDYRMGPEAKFPAAVDDAFAALGWVAAQAGALGIDAGRIAVAGDSAGGNLAAVVSLTARDQGGPAVAFQVLFYPAVDLSMAFDSQRRLAEGYLLTVHNQRWFHGHYLRSEADKADWRASPLKAARHDGLPPAYVLTAGYDPLCDEGAAYAARLGEAGVTVETRHYPGQIHGFLTMGGVIAEAGRALDDAGAALRAALRPA